MKPEEQNKVLQARQTSAPYWDKYRALITQMFAPSGQIFPRPREVNQITKVPAIVITVAMITLRRKERGGGTLFSIRTGAEAVVARGQWPLMLTGVPRSIQL